MQFDETFTAEVWKQDSTGAWHFVTLPATLSQRIRTLSSGMLKPFGSFPVKASTGRSAWGTSLFADTKRDAFVLPLKAAVRRREKISLGDKISVRITFGL